MTAIPRNASTLGPQRSQSDPQGSQSDPKDSQSSPKWPPAPKVSPRSPKGSLKWSPEASPDVLKSMKKGVHDHPGTPLRKWTSPSCENPIIHYVLNTSGNRIFLKSDENAAPAMLLEPTKKPVLAREREARLFFKTCFTMFSTALLWFAVFYSALLCSTLVYVTPLYPTLLYSRVDPEYLRNN